MKTSIKQLAAGTFIALILLVGNVKANGTEIKASSHESIETALQLENWMTNETIWNTNSFNNTEFVQETEANMEIESWMTSETIWNAEEKIKDEKLLLENWMVDSEIWK